MTEQSIFGDKRPDIIRLEDLYDPDNPAGSGNIIPSLDTIIIETWYNKKYAYVVTDVDENNKTTYIPLEMPEFVEASSIIDYGNNKFFCFFDDRVEPTKLNIDMLLMIPGTVHKEYRLRRIDPTSKEEQIISVYYDNNGTYKGDRVPLNMIDELGCSYPTNCHTHLVLNQNETIYMDLFDGSGTQTGEVVLFTKRAVIVNNYDRTPIITDFLLEGNQTTEDGFYLYTQQDKSALNLTPVIVYNTGKRVQIPVDNQVCFLYGFDNIVSAYPGLKQTICCKYFLRTEQSSSSATDTGHGRFEMVEKEIVVIDNITKVGCKLSVIPKWNVAQQKYELKFILYTATKDRVIDVTSDVSINSEFYPDEFNKTQRLECVIDLQPYYESSNAMEHVQNIWLRLNHPNTGMEKYTIKSSEITSKVYGVESTSIRRPVLHYDPVEECYFIPTSVFENKEAVLEAFYEKADPIFDPLTEVGPVTPTHFTIRDTNTIIPIISTPIPIEEYNQALIPMLPDNLGRYVGSNLIVEFLLCEQDEYKIIYGVPVDVYQTQTGYNG